jgi:anaerobic magnesium-protoporphyrin IX monomethyl ester cyclase
MRSKLVILYYPRLNWMTELERGWHRFPYAVWSLVPGLTAAGYNVMVFDGRLDDEREKFLGALKLRPLFVGISSLTGVQLLDGMWAGQKVREVDPTIPIVWGGWHVTLSPEESLQERLVDIVVAGRGEELIVQVAKALESGDRSTTLYSQEKILDSFPKIPFHLVDINKYGPIFGYLTSTGCVWGCTFCAIQQVYKHKMYFKPMDQVIGELKYIADNYRGLRHIDIDDELFFINTDRVIEFCDRWSTYKGITLSVLAHVNIVVKYDLEIWNKIVMGGFSHILIGAESGNQTVLNRLKKHQTPERMLRFSELTARHNISPEFSCMTGFPDSDELDDFKDTVIFLQKAGSLNPRTLYKLFWARPYPGTELFKTYLGEGIRMPQNFKQWGDYTLRTTPNWVSRELEDKVHFFTGIFQPKHGWNYDWELFVKEFERARSQGPIPTPAGL